MLTADLGEAVPLGEVLGKLPSARGASAPREAAPCAWEGAHTGTVGNTCFQFSEEEFMVPVQEVQSLDPGKTHLKSVHLRTV